MIFQFSYLPPGAGGHGSDGFNHGGRVSGSSLYQLPSAFLTKAGV